MKRGRWRHGGAANGTAVVEISKGEVIVRKPEMVLSEEIHAQAIKGRRGHETVSKATNLGTLHHQGVGLFERTKPLALLTKLSLLGGLGLLARGTRASRGVAARAPVSSGAPGGSDFRHRLNDSDIRDSDDR